MTKSLTLIQTFSISNMTRIRSAEPTDTPAIARIFQDIETYGHTLQLPYSSEASWQDKLNSRPDGHYGLVAIMQDEIVGHIGLEAYQRPRRKHAGTLGIAVHAGYQGQKVGSHLMAACLDLADNWLNLSRLELTVFSDNLAAIALYRKFGFIREGTAEQFAFRNGQFVSIDYMARLKSIAR